MDNHTSFRSISSTNVPNMVVTPSYAAVSSIPSASSSKLQSLQNTLAALEYEKEKRIQAEQRAYELRQKLAASSTGTIDKNKVSMVPSLSPTVSTVLTTNDNRVPETSLLLPSTKTVTTTVEEPSPSSSAPSVPSSSALVPSTTNPSNPPLVPRSSSRASSISTSSLVPIERSNTIITNLLPTNMELAMVTLSDKVRTQATTMDTLERQLTKEKSSKETLQIENQQLKKEIEQLKIKLNEETMGATNILRQNEIHSNETITRLESHVTALGKQLVTVQAEAGSNTALAEERRNRITNLVARLEVARKEAETAETERRKMQSTVIGLETRIQRSETNAQALENERNTLKQRLSDMAAEINDLRRSNATNTTSATTLSLGEQNDQKLRFEHQLAIAETRALTLEREVIALRESRSNLLATMREADANLERLSSTVEQAEERENNVRKELATVLAEKARTVAELTARATQAEKDNIGVRTRLDSMVSQVTDAERRVTQYAERLTTVEHQYKDSQQLLSNARAELAIRTSEIDSLHAQINTMATDNELLRSRYQELQQQYQQQQLLILTTPTTNSASTEKIETGSDTDIVRPSRSMNASIRNEISDPLDLLHNSDTVTARTVSTFDINERTAEESNVVKPPVLENLTTTTMDGPLATYLPKKIKQNHASSSSSLVVIPEELLAVNPATTTTVVSSSLLTSPRSVSSSVPSHPHHATLQVIQANHRRVNGAFTSVLFAGPQFTDRLRTVKKLIEENATKQIIIALITSGTKSAGQFAGIYTVVDNSNTNPNTATTEGFVTKQSSSSSPGTSSSSLTLNTSVHLATRIYGYGPLTIFPSMIHTLFKYDTVTREFRDIGFNITNTLPVSTDAVGIDPSWISVAKREKRLENK